MSPERIATIVLGLGAALGLAVLAAHPRVRRWEQRLGVTVLLSSGLPFFLLGAFFHLDSVGILTESILQDLSPAFEFGLGWIGFVIGTQLQVQRLDRLPKTLGPAITVQALAPMFTTAILCAPVLILLGLSPGEGFWRDLLLLTACAAASAPVSLEALTRRYGAAGAELIAEMTNLDELAALALMGLISVFLRPAAVTVAWVLPPSAWLLMLMGLGMVLGVFTYVLLRGAKSEAEEIALLLGSVALAAGIAGYLSLSVPVVCAIAGALLANLPIRDREGLTKLLLDVERPIYLIFLMVVGASWRPEDWQGWLLAPVFVLARLSGKGLGSIWAKRIGPEALPAPGALSLELMPQSPIAVVVIVGTATRYGGAPPKFVLWAVNAIILGSLLTELLVRLLQRRGGQPSAPPQLEARVDHEAAP
jgi:hypothetical protein